MTNNEGIVEKLSDVIIREKHNFMKRSGNLKDVLSKFAKMGINMHSEYSLPLKDTIGRTFNDQIQFKNQKK
ncbi:MAG: hypothetical protein IPM26_12750 [Saprospiraceae bacterium]|nr:hypothetical protein [Saprospiraceae bacterium]